ncbi:protein hunchback-like [Achroia grisella]|uniref:protein hunchback-like n=1 Tax=Achroia grisella TaxID=688607 RepID=UPI0027D327A8|nr:protein hunchback-like [Achroia grisella]
MISCASPAGMPPAPHSAHTQPWGPLLQPPAVKAEPMDDASYSKEQTSGFYSEGFHSASPSSSSKDSNGHSPRSVGSAGEPSPFYDNLPLKAKANLGVHLDSYRGGVPYSLLTPPSFEHRTNDGREPSPGFDTSYSPRSLVPPAHVSTPLARADATPPKSPRTPSSPERDHERRSFERFHDSGFDGVQNKQDIDDGRDGSGLEDDFDEEPGLRVPAVNSHGKVKTFKCKQCEFVAVTKLSFWEHSKEHIKPEKMLCCRKCPFVTEYKHHLEYHMRNHLGSKPFQCSQCSYSCVNKSMLNSHLKSHSNVYQYRCADCNYATKYCHSLKLHLRKYQHNPAMVLNIDGTPNPLPIIDVYGTRRGPKQKPLSKIFEQQVSMNNNSSQPQPPPPTHPLFGSHFPVNLPYLPPLLPHSFLFPPNNNYEQRTSPKQCEMIPDKQATSPPPSILHQRLSYGERPSEVGTTTPPATSPASLPRTPTTRNSSPIQTNDALDLTNGKSSEAGSPPPTEQHAPVTPTTALKNRRKGRAFKLQPAALRLQHQDEKMREAEASDSESDEEAPPTTAQNTYSCQYCDITFGDLTMHTIHMGFHGYNDPFMCNKCGERSGDRVAFFIHLGRAQHA